MNKIEEQFSQNAHSYEQYSTIQKEVVKALLSNIVTKPNRILEMGSGTGEVYKQLSWSPEHFIATDISVEMCKMHPNNKHVSIRKISFDSEELFDLLQQDSCDFLISSSALHWSSDIESLFERVKKSKTPFAFSLFTAGTFSSFLSELDVSSYLKDKEYFIHLFNKYFLGSYKIEKYYLSFKNSRELLRYIKKTGVSINKESVSVGKLKKWVDSKPSLELEFEVLFFYSDNR